MEEPIPTPIVYRVPEQNLTVLMERIKRLQRRSAAVKGFRLSEDPDDHDRFDLRNWALNLARTTQQ